MDRFPLIPQNTTDHDILPLLREICQENLREATYPKNIAENYHKYEVEVEFESLQKTGITTVKTYAKLENLNEDITRVEDELLNSHIYAILKKQFLPNFEEIQLKKLSLFEKLSNYALQAYNLIQKSDFYPSFIEQKLNFIYNPALHTCCQPCPPKPPKLEKIPPSKTKPVGKPELAPSQPLFKAEPPEIIFFNYELNTKYSGKFKLRNVTASPQYFAFNDLPKSSQFKLKMMTDTCRLAPGMSAEFLVTFEPQIYQNSQETIHFKTANSVDILVEISNLREAPKLDCYVFNPFVPLDSVMQPKPGSRYFSNRRQNATNFTIDCGTCLLGNFQVVSVIMKNRGQKGQFFITTENEWFYNNLNDSACRIFELTQGVFTIFPTFFEIETNEVGQIFVLFSPEKFGVFTEKLFIVCDNNTYQEIELLGDCIAFNDNFLKVNMYLVDDTFEYEKRVLKFISLPNQTSNIIFSVMNKSPVQFPYYWALKTYKTENPYKKMNPDWVKILNGTNYLPSFSTTDVVVQITPQIEEKGDFYILLSLYLKRIPLEGFVKINDDTSLLSEKSSNSSLESADVHMFELQIICRVEIPEKIERPSQDNPITVIKQETSVETHQSIRFSRSVINFGLLPKGLEISENLYVRNLTDREIDWKIMEIYQDGSDHLVSVIHTCKPSEGRMKPKFRKKIIYTVQAKEYTRRVHYLMLFSSPDCTCQTYLMEDLCLVIYDIIEIQVVLTSDNNTNILSPKEFLYVGIPSYHKLYIHNKGLIAGCFYFLKPEGTNSDQIVLKYSQQCGIIFPNVTIEVVVELCALEVGIYEDIRVPCFIGNTEKFPNLKISCTVASINLYFYLPNDDLSYQKFLWPPKSGTSYWNYEMVGEDFSSDLNNRGESQPALTPTLYSISNLDDLVAPDSVIPTYPTIRTRIISVKKSAKISFYFENVTPVSGHFSVNPTNYSPDESCINNILVKAKTRPPEFFWEKACLDGYGIVVEAERPSGDILAYEVVQINLWIYANTWGKYLEEVIVEINDLTPFCFNLLIEVEGLPIEFPFAKNTILPTPTIRFENVPYETENVTRSFTVTNISAIPLEISWHVYTPTKTCCKEKAFNAIVDFEDDEPKLALTRSFYGFQSCLKCVNVNPSEFILDKLSSEIVTVSVTSTGFVPSFEKINLKYKLIGFIKAKTDRFKENYYKREGGVDVSPAKIEVLVTLEQAILQVDIQSDDTKIDVFVNDILLKNYQFPEIYLLLRNIDRSCISCRLEIDKPFRIVKTRHLPSGATNLKDINLLRNECLQVIVTCFFTHEEIVQYGDLIYRDKNENFSSSITKNLNIYQNSLPRQVIPFQVCLHYPHISVTPTVLKFVETLIYCCRKSILTIFNMTASVVKFEIYKSSDDDFSVNPSFGEIPGSTGKNKQFIDINVYFTPKKCKSYVESLRIYTNIPNYFIDVGIYGYGTNNEKFLVD